MVSQTGLWPDPTEKRFANHRSGEIIEAKGTEWLGNFCEVVLGDEMWP
jgi:hypothetical protein